MDDLSDVNAYPLHWPEGEPRTAVPEPSQFQRPRFDVERQRLLDEIDRLVLGPRARTHSLRRDLVVISTNLPLRLDGEPRAGARPPDDPGVAVYFVRSGKPMAFACDRWATVAENMRAIVKTIEAIRGVDRWGVASASDRAFTGFQALPGPVTGDPPWHEVFGVAAHAPTQEVREAYQRQRKRAHPDAGGDAVSFARVQRAWEGFCAERGITR